MSKIKRGESAQGVIYGFTAYIIWGIVPIYWPLLQPAGAVEILAHRVIWSLFVLLAFLAVKKRIRNALQIFKDPNKIALLTVA